MVEQLGLFKYVVKKLGFGVWFTVKNSANFTSFFLRFLCFRVSPVDEISIEGLNQLENAKVNDFVPEVVGDLHSSQVTSESNCNECERIVEQTDDILTVTTTDCSAEAHHESESATANNFVKETNLSELSNSTVEATHCSSSQDQPSTSQTVEHTMSMHSNSLPTSAILIRKPHSRKTLDSESQTSPHSIPTNLAMPVLDKAVTKTKRDKETLRKLLHFVAMTEKEKIKNKDAFVIENIMVVS